MTTRRAVIVSDEELKSRALELSQAPATLDAGDGGQIELVVLRLGRESFALPVDLVREVVADPAVTALPMAPPIVAGVISLRGELLAVLSLERILELPPSEQSGRFAIIVHDADIRAAWLVDAVDGIEWFTPSPEPILATVPAGPARFLSGAYRSGSRLITEINVRAVLTQPDLQPPDEGPA